MKNLKLLAILLVVLLCTACGGNSGATVTETTTELITEATGIKDSLARQVYSTVKWQQTMEKMLADGVDTFYEIGPGKTLSGFMKRIDRSKKVISINTVDDLNAIG